MMLEIAEFRIPANQHADFEAAMQEFVEELRAHTKAYLYQRYALLEFPPLKQRMKRWLWLYEQKVVSLEEFNTQFPNRRQQ